MTLKQFRQILRALGDDTRLRLLNLVSNCELNVKDICSSLEVAQPTISKHLMRLRLLRLVTDRREGNMVHYKLNLKSEQGNVALSIIKGAKRLGIFEKDLQRLRKQVK